MKFKKYQTPQKNELENNGRTSNKSAQGNFFGCPRIKGAPFIRYFRVDDQREIKIRDHLRHDYAPPVGKIRWFVYQILDVPCRPAIWYKHWGTRDPPQHKDYHKVRIHHTLTPSLSLMLFL